MNCIDTGSALGRARVGLRLPPTICGVEQCERSK